MRYDLIKIVHSMVLDSHIPAKALAKEVGKPYSTLLREINPYDAGAKLGVETLLLIMKSTGNVKPLEFMAEQLGYELTLKRARTNAAHAAAGQKRENRASL